MNYIEIIIALITGVGGYKALELIFNYFINKRKKTSEDDKVIFNNNFEIFQKQLDFLKNQVEILTQQITDRDELIDKLNKQVNELEDTVNALTNDKKNLQNTICYDMNCPLRKK